MTKQQLEVLIGEIPDPELVEELQKLMMRSLSLKPIVGGNTSELSSRFGGLPYVPRDFCWPMSSPGEERDEDAYDASHYPIGPLRFLCQINLEDLPFVDVSLDLPERGVLAFFAATNQYDVPSNDIDGNDWLVTCVEPGSGEIAVPPPLSREFVKLVGEESLCGLHDDSIVGPEFLIEFSEHWQVNPYQFFRGDYYLNNEEAIASRIPDSYSKLDKICGDFLHLFGGAAAIDRSCAEDHAAYFLEVPVGDVSQLLQLQSDDDIELVWQSCGTGNFLVRNNSPVSEVVPSVLVTRV